MRLGVISFQFGKDNFIIIGEIFDKTIIDLNYILNIYKDLFYFCPFKCFYEKNKIKTTIEDDLTYLRKKYRLTHNIVSKNKFKNGSSFYSPILFDISNNKRIYKRQIINISYESPCDSIGIILPILNPMERGNVIDQVLLSKPKNILVSNNQNQTHNQDSISIKSFRYLRKREYPKNSIIKNFSSNIHDILDILDLSFQKKDIIIGCDYETMIGLRNEILDRKVTYRCPY